MAHVLDRRKGSQRTGRRQLERSISPQKAISEFNIADRKLRSTTLKFEELKHRLGIRTVSDSNLRRLKKSWAGNPKKLRVLAELMKLKPEYVKTLKGSAWFRRLVKLRLVRDPKFVQVENMVAFTHNVFRIIRSVESSKKPYSSAIIDLDKFKAINDGFGHGVGDVVISKIADQLNGLARQFDGSAARVGGEEFRVFVPVSGKQLVLELERLQKDFSSQLADPTKLNISPVGGWGRWKVPSFSAGVSGRIGRGRTVNLGKVVSSLATESDRALYKSKRLGRNRVTLT